MASVRDTAVTTMDVDALDLSTLYTDASQLLSTPGVPSASATEEFLNRYPIPVLFRALEASNDLKSLVSSTLEKVFSSHSGAVALYQSLPFAVAGLEASSPSVKRMTCLGISKLLGCFADNEPAARALISNDIVNRVLDAVTDEDDQVASAAAEAIQNFAMTSIGADYLFKGQAARHMVDVVSHASSLVKVRFFSVIAFLFNHSVHDVEAIKELGILQMLESELGNGSDVLAQMNALELVHEIFVTPDGAKFLTDCSFLQKLISLMEGRATDDMVRSRSMMIGASLVSPDEPSRSLVSKNDAMRMILAIDTLLRSSEHSGSREREGAIDALGRIGMSKLGAELLLERPLWSIQHIMEAVFTRRGGSEQLVAIHALAALGGSERSESSLLSDQAEMCLRELMFSKLENLPKRSLSDLIHWLLQQAYEMRLAVYRLIIPFAARSWFLVDMCSNKEIVTFLTDPHSEQSKEGMEWRHSCCVAISTNLGIIGNRLNSTLLNVLEKFQAAVARGPYLARERAEARPLVVTQDRF